MVRQTFASVTWTRCGEQESSCSKQRRQERNAQTWVGWVAQVLTTLQANVVRVRGFKCAARKGKPRSGIAANLWTAAAHSNNSWVRHVSCERTLKGVRSARSSPNAPASLQVCYIILLRCIAYIQQHTVLYIQPTCRWMSRNFYKYGRTASCKWLQLRLKQGPTRLLEIALAVAGGHGGFNVSSPL
jgi:hypothetical protein